jgi:predicted transcriptional regulator
LKLESEEIKKLLKQLYLLRAILYLTFVIALGTTALTVAPSLIQFSVYRPLVPGPSAQTTFPNATKATTATTLYSSTVSTAAGYSVTPTAFTPNTFNYYGFTALISWSVFGAALIWRGRVRSVWGQSRFSYDTFRLLVKMRGSQTRLKLMRSLSPPKNKLQLATALGIDWKAVDKHVQLLAKNGLIQAASTNGTATYYEVTDKGRSLLQVLEQLSNDISPSAESNA